MYIKEHIHAKLSMKIPRIKWVAPLYSWSIPMTRLDEAWTGEFAKAIDNPVWPYGSCHKDNAFCQHKRWQVMAAALTYAAMPHHWSASGAGTPYFRDRFYWKFVWRMNNEKREWLQEEPRDRKEKQLWFHTNSCNQSVARAIYAGIFPSASSSFAPRPITQGQATCWLRIKQRLHSTIYVVWLILHYFYFLPTYNHPFSLELQLHGSTLERL